MALEFPEIVRQGPLSPNRATNYRPDIWFDWSVAIDATQFSDSVKRARFVELRNEDTGNEVTTEFVEYIASQRRVVLKPAIDLDPNTTYSVLINHLVESTLGRKSKAPFRWMFVTDGTAIDSFQLIEPANFTVLENFPTFSWIPIASSDPVEYVFQLADQPNFSVPIYTNTTTSTSVSPLGAFTDGITYYWRVQATTPTLTGDWSATYQFYYGTIRSAHQTSKQTWTQPQDFAVANVGFENGASNLSVYPDISITFLSTPVSEYADYVTVWAKSMGARTDDRTTFSEAEVDGVWSIVDRTITFTPTNPIDFNMRYEVRIKQDLSNIDGASLGTNVTYYFTGPYTPMYATVNDIRARFLSAEQNVPDDLINYYIYQASLIANQRYYGGLDYATASESLVRDSMDLQGFSVGMWVQAAATYQMLKAILFEMTRYVGTKRQLGDYEFSLSADFLKAIDMALKLTEKDLAEYDEFLTPLTPLIATFASRWSPCMRDFDWSVRDLEAKRDDSICYKDRGGC